MRGSAADRVLSYASDKMACLWISLDERRARMGALGGDSGARGKNLVRYGANDETENSESFRPGDFRAGTELVRDVHPGIPQGAGHRRGPRGNSSAGCRACCDT